MCCYGDGAGADMFKKWNTGYFLGERDWKDTTVNCNALTLTGSLFLREKTAIKDILGTTVEILIWTIH